MKVEIKQHSSKQPMNLLKVAKIFLSSKFIDINSFINLKKTFQINELQKAENYKYEFSRTKKIMKIVAEINEIETRNIIKLSVILKKVKKTNF